MLLSFLMIRVEEQICGLTEILISVLLPHLLSQIFVNCRVDNVYDRRLMTSFNPIDELFGQFSINVSLFPGTDSLMKLINRQHSPLCFTAITI